MKGFEPLIMISKTTALPLGYISKEKFLKNLTKFNSYLL